MIIDARKVRITLITVTLLSLVALACPRSARGDAAPPERPPGSSVGPGEAVTQVQMLWEEVLLEIEGKDTPLERMDLAANQMQAHVTATFVMRNQGKVEEAFDVWFPLGAPDGYFNVTTVSDFRAWVNGDEAKVGEEQREGQWDSIVPWATWPATFPPGEDVVLRVTYDVVPDGYSPYGTFPYVLETGAGWLGPIGEGTITFRLPYKVNRFNTVLNPKVYGGPQTEWMSPNPADYTVIGTDVVWRFKDLEPTAEDNIALTVLAPLVWEEMLAARKDAVSMPDSAAAQLRLARTLIKALHFRYGLSPIGASADLGEEAQTAFRRALELAPADVNAYIDYLDFLQLLPAPGLPELSEDFVPTLERALKLDPSNGRLLSIQEWLTGIEPYLVTATPTPESTATARATARPAQTPTPTNTATRRPTASPSPTRTATATPEPTTTTVPTMTSAPSATSVAARALTYEATSTPAPESGRGGICPGTAALFLAPAGVLLWQRRTARRRQRG